MGQGIIERIGIHQSDALEHHRQLQGKKRLLGIDGMGSQRGRRGMVPPGQLHQRRGAGRRHPSVQRPGAGMPTIDRHQRATAAQPQATHRLDRQDGSRQPLIAAELLQRRHQLQTAGSAAAAGRAAADPGHQSTPAAGASSATTAGSAIWPSTSSTGP